MGGGGSARGTHFRLEGPNVEDYSILRSKTNWFYLIIACIYNLHRPKYVRMTMNIACVSLNASWRVNCITVWYSPDAHLHRSKSEVVSMTPTLVFVTILLRTVFCLFGGDMKHQIISTLIRKWGPPSPSLEDFFSCFIETHLESPQWLSEYK